MTQPRKLTLKRGDTIGKDFKVIKRLGEGGCGSVYCCDYLPKQVRVAVKVLDNLSDFPRFKREAKVLRRTKSPYVVKWYGQGTHDNHPFVAMEYMEGGSLRDLLDKVGKLSLENTANVMLQVVRGLKTSKTVHRDLKPENILLGGKPKRGRDISLHADDLRIKVTDFGLAMASGEDSMQLTQTGQVMGTPVYMSPEQCRNTKNVSFKTDIYALGIIMFEMLTGKVPFDASNVYDIMAMHCNDEVKYPARFPDEARAICERCLQKRTGKRYPSLAALERDIENLLGVEHRSSKMGLVIVIALVLLLALGAAYWYRVPLVEWLNSEFAWQIELPQWLR